MARISVPPSLNSRATSSIAGSDSVTRTAPSVPTSSASRRARSVPPFRFARACGLTTTPMPGTSGRRARAGQLPARRLDVLPAALAHGRVEPVLAQDRLEAIDPPSRARLEAGARERVERDQVDLRAEPVKQADETARVGVGVVLAGQHDVLERDALPLRERQRTTRVEKRGEGPAPVHRHEPRALRIGRRGERDGEIHARLGDEALDRRHDADGRHGDPPRRDRVAPLRGEDLERRAHGVVVGERLAHPHEDDVGDGPWRRERTPGAHLADDLRRREVADEVHARRRAEHAAHAAAGLARDAEREPVTGAVGALELRDEDALDRGGAVPRQPKEQLPRAVARVRDDGGHEPADREVGREVRTQRAREARHRVERLGALPVHPGEDLLRPVRRLARALAPRREIGAGKLMDVAGHAAILATPGAARHAGALRGGRRAGELEAGEEEANLGARRVRTVGAVHRVLLDVGTELAPDRPLRRLLRVGRSHELAPARDGAVGLEDADEYRAGAHEADQVAEEAALAVDGVEALGVARGEPYDARGDRRQALLLDHGEDAAESALAHGVRLHDAERPFRHLASPLSFSTCCMVTPSSAGLGATVTPARRNASIFSAAVPFPPAMMAPACPMRLPFGAVCPAMNPTTGFFTCAAMNAAASSSADPPISPIMMTASVPGSFWKRPSASTNPVPMIGSPPMPMHVDCPRPSNVSWCTASYVSVPLRDTTATRPGLWM